MVWCVILYFAEREIRLLKRICTQLEQSPDHVFGSDSRTDWPQQTDMDTGVQLTLSPLQTALVWSKIMNGRVHCGNLVLKGLIKQKLNCTKNVVAPFPMIDKYRVDQWSVAMLIL